ncbi:MAG: galactokinase [Chitinophagales bacterium]|jgi:galactokinase
MKTRLRDSFFLHYQKDADILVQAPCRINIIGEHTDYNGGLVLPAAINYHIYFAVAQTVAPVVFIYDENKDKRFSYSLDEELDLDGLSQWRKYYYGAIKILQEKHELPGFQVLKVGKAPIGAGISSSAALCCGFIYSLNELFHLGLDRWTIAKLARRVEQEYVGLQCGIMDQFAVLFGESNKALSLNCSDLSYTTHDIKLKDYRFMLINSQVKHNLADSAYNERVEEMNEVRRLLGKQDLNAASKEEVLGLPEVLSRRMQHHLFENQRVKSMIAALEDDDYFKAGNILHAGHISLQEYYEVTCEETDFLVETLLDAGAPGARQMGGGFGGCVLALVKEKDAAAIAEYCFKEYSNRFNLDLVFYNFEITSGVSTL